MSAMVHSGLPDVEIVWALDLAGRKIHGPATRVEIKTDDYGTPPWGFSGVRHIRALPQHLIVHFLDGKVDVYFATTSEEMLDRMIFRKAENERKAKVERERIKRERSNRVKVTDLAGHVIRKVQMNAGTIIFTLENDHVWAFDVQAGEMDPNVGRPWVLSNGGAVTEVSEGHSLLILTDKPGYLTIPAVIGWSEADEDDDLRFSYAYEPTKDQLRDMPVITERKNY